VGIPSRYLRQALLEERTRPPVEARGGLLAWLVGPGRLSAQRVVAGEPAAVDRALGAWMQQEELLQVKRHYPDRTTWEPKVGAFASIQRALGAGGRRFALARAAEVAGQVTPLESGFCHVQLVADVRNGRRQRLGGTCPSRCGRRRAPESRNPSPSSWKRGSSRLRTATRPSSACISRPPHPT